ncbi:hypothetical protein [Paenibacillus sp. DMB5]|uniref:hypothetical protein n=1 Tax=Paenibacillus sp. DMB5 TaxID=1780103 RepID=UPI00076C3627|nr:hypothetical protein [Paenibacillus sp. DMB5]KUP22397.1 hypothetical protein AWJ19_27650 [Paenibacillus sp. DMB5]
MDIWEVAGPLIMTMLVLLLVGVALAIIVRKMERGLMRNILVKITPVFLAMFLLGAITYFSGIWGSR